jgi:hypothetical protein
VPGRLALGVVAVCALAFVAADDPPVVSITRARRVDDDYRRGLARYADGWIFAGERGLWRTDDDLRLTVARTSAIPAQLRARGYRRIGDVDVAGAYLYAPLEQPDDTRNEQVVARYDAKSLEFVDSFTLRQHENAFVAIDARAGTAYSIDRRAGDRLLRYDLGGLRWRALPPLPLSRRVEQVEGADLGDGFIYLSTSNKGRPLSRVSLGNGAVTDLRSFDLGGREARGLDFTPLASGRVHTLARDDQAASMSLIDLGVPPPRRTGRAEQWILAVTVAGTLVATVAIVGLTRRRRRRRFFER